MPRRAIQKIAEPPGTLSPEASLQLWAEHRGAARLARFDAWIEALSKLGANAPADSLNLDEMTAEFLDGLGLAMQADRIVFYSATALGRGDGARDGEERLEAAALWTLADEGGPGVEGEAALCIDRDGDCGRNLRAGFAHRASDLADIAPSRAARAHTKRWAPVRATLYVPCLANANLLGVVGIEGTLGASRWSPPVVGRAEFACRLYANLLERSRLSRQVEAGATRDAQTDRLCSVGGVASRVAHDFNNILTAILGYADLLELEFEEDAADGSGGKGTDEVAEIRRAALRGADLVEQVLSLGRTQKKRIEPIDLAETLAGFEGTLRRVLGSEVAFKVGVAVEAQSQADVESRNEPTPQGTAETRVACADSERSGARVALDPGQLERILLNLTVNARDALGNGVGDPCFEISTRGVEIDSAGHEASARGGAGRPVPSLAAGKYIRLTARDNGCGIEAGLLERVFEPFFTTKDRTGTGLGLAITTEFVRAAGGGVRVESEPGEGTAFHLYFPQVEDAVAEPPLISESASDSPEDRLCLEEHEPTPPTDRGPDPTLSQGPA